MDRPAIDLVFVARSARRSPFVEEPFWWALAAAGLAPPSTVPLAAKALAAHGIALREIDSPKPARDEADREAAAARAADRLEADVAELERELHALGSPVVAFVGAALFAAALGSRAADAAEATERLPDHSDDPESAETRPRVSVAERTLDAPVPFGGGVAVAVPALSPRVPPETLRRAFLTLAALRDGRRRSVE